MKAAFCVNHKEKIKVIRRSVDVQTLSATPIPRTLEIRSTGILDMTP
jgi:transcription-repair coupling factor (superfamily II helicase)